MSPFSWFFLEHLKGAVPNLPKHRGKAFAAKIARGWLLPMGTWRFLGVGVVFSPTGKECCEWLDVGVLEVTLQGTNIFAPENGWLEDVFFLGDGLFSGAVLVSGRVSKIKGSQN